MSARAARGASVAPNPSASAAEPPARTSRRVAKKRVMGLPPCRLAPPPAGVLATRPMIGGGPNECAASAVRHKGGTRRRGRDAWSHGRLPECPWRVRAAAALCARGGRPVSIASGRRVPMGAAHNVLIVGAGMAGMSLGVALRRAGIDCEIVEIRPALSEPGTGISLQGPALRALKTIGVVDRCVAQGFGYSHFKTCDAAGNVTGTVELPRLPGPGYPATLGIMRQAVHNV